MSKETHSARAVFLKVGDIAPLWTLGIFGGAAEGPEKIWGR